MLLITLWLNLLRGAQFLYKNLPLANKNRYCMHQKPFYDRLNGHNNARV